jgi:uncharacterized membrane protein
MSERAWNMEGADRGRGAASAVYALYTVAPFTLGLLMLVGAVLAYGAKGGAEGVARPHLDRQIRLFWLVLVLMLPVLALRLIGFVPVLGLPFDALAWVIGGLISIWVVLSSVFGFMRLQGGRPPKG